jgi:hypothetical protein
MNSKPVFPQSNDELIELLKKGGKMDYVTLPDGTIKIAVCPEETDLGYGGLCQYCGEFFSNWKIKHEIHCDKNPSPNYDLIEAEKERDKLRFSQLGYCSLCNQEMTQSRYYYHRKKNHVGEICKFIKKKN